MISRIRTAALFLAIPLALTAIPLVLTATAFAAEDFDAVAVQAGWRMFLDEVIRSIDAIGFAMIIFFIALLGMCVDLFGHLRIGKLIPESLLNDVQEEMTRGEYEKALEICQKSGSLAGEVFAAALGKTDFSFERMSESMRAEMRIQGLAWRQWVGQFRTVAAIGLLLGVAGFIVETMRFIADMAGRPNLELALASSFELRSLSYGALFALFMGVMLAVVALAASTYAHSKLEKILLEAERLGEELLDPFRPLPSTMEELG